MIQITISGANVEELQKELPSIQRLLTYYVEPQPGVKEDKRIKNTKEALDEMLPTTADNPKLPEKKKPGRKPKVKVEETEPEVAEPANKHIMDAFDAELEAKGEKVTEEDLEDLIVEEKPAPVSAKAPTYEEIRQVVTQMINKKKSEGKDGLAVMTDILAAYKIKKVGELKEEHYSNFIQKVRSVM